MLCQVLLWNGSHYMWYGNTTCKTAQKCIKITETKLLIDFAAIGLSPKQNNKTMKLGKLYSLISFIRSPFVSNMVFNMPFTLSASTGSNCSIKSYPIAV